MDGILNINKPQDRTSFSVVAQIRRLSKERRVGHAGTLDTMAVGVLPVCMGKGTRVVQFLMGVSKVYRARIKLGVTTDTYDATGEVTQEGDASNVSLEQIKTALDSFCGTIMQKPPIYSALKYGGQRLYKLAREGIEVDIKSRPITIYSIELIDYQPPLVTIEVECARGTYIRSLAYDLGQMLGCGAHLEHLVRLKYGPFDIKDAISLEQVEEACTNDTLQKYIYPMDTVLKYLPSIIVEEEQECLIKHGGCVVVEEGEADVSGESRCRAYNKDGYFIAILRFDSEKKLWHPEKVFV